MGTITTARILADKALNHACGQECVDWAISMLAQGKSGYYLAMLAGMLPPLNHFEISEYRDRSLKELSVEDIKGPLAISTYSAERLRLMLAGEVDILSTLRVIRDLCIHNDYQQDIYDFYLLYFAYTDLMEEEVQWYWEGGTRENIDSIIRQRAEDFLKSTGNP